MLLLVLHFVHLCRYLRLPQVSLGVQIRFRLAPYLPYDFLSQSTLTRQSQSIAKFKAKKEALRKTDAYRSLVTAITPRQALTFWHRLRFWRVRSPAVGVVGPLAMLAGAFFPLSGMRLLAELTPAESAALREGLVPPTGFLLEVALPTLTGFDEVVP